jgi:hypothetical protein
VNIPRINSIVNDEDSGTDSTASSRRQSKINHHHIRTTNQWNDEKLKTRQLPNILTAKSSFSSGYRYSIFTLKLKKKKKNSCRSLFSRYLQSVG